MVMSQDKDKSTSHLSQTIYDRHPRLFPTLNRKSLIVNHRLWKAMPFNNNLNI